MKPYLFVGAVAVIGVSLLTAGNAPRTDDQAAQPPRIEVDDSQVEPSYANFSRVTGSPEELILDFAVNSNPTGIPEKPIKIRHRIAMNYYTAKRFLGALQLTVQRHEEAFGPIETDIQKRLKLKPRVEGPDAAR